MMFSYQANQSVVNSDNRLKMPATKLQKSRPNTRSRVCSVWILAGLKCQYVPVRKAVEEEAWRVSLSYYVLLILL